MKGKEMGFTYTFKPEIRINPKIPEQISIEEMIKCPQCNFPIITKKGYMVCGGNSRSKYYCMVCGHSFGNDELK